MLASVILFAVPAVRRAAERDRWRFGVALFLGAILLALSLGRLWPEPWPIAGHLPRRPDFYATALALGWLVFEADTMPRRLFCAAAAYVLPAAYWAATDSHAVLARSEPR